jgi:hypothetical protein
VKAERAAIAGARRRQREQSRRTRCSVSPPFGGFTLSSGRTGAPVPDAYVAVWRRGQSKSWSSVGGLASAVAAIRCQAAESRLCRCWIRIRSGRQRFLREAQEVWDVAAILRICKKPFATTTWPAQAAPRQRGEREHRANCELEGRKGLQPSCEQVQK